MIQRMNNYVSMCRAVQYILHNHEAVWTSNVAFKQVADAYLLLMSELGAAVEGAEIVTTGATKDKMAAKMSAVSLAVNMAKRASVYALETKNMELHDQLYIRKTPLCNRADTMVLAKLRQVHSLLASIVSELGDYHITTEDLVELNGMNDALEARISHPRTLIVQRKGYNQEAIPRIVTGIKEVLYKMDNLINLYAGTVLERSYMDARIVVDRGGKLPDVVVPESPE